MKVLLINTTEKNGGAAIACKRLFEAHRNSGRQAQYLFLDSVTQKAEGRFSYMSAKFNRLKRFFLYLEKLHFTFFQKDKSYRFKFSTAKYGYNISQHPAVQEADVLNIHWVQQGFLSLRSIQQLIDTGKPIVWTLHDMWVFTGGCHYTESCENFKNECGSCFMLKQKGPNDLSVQIMSKKEKLFREQSINYVTSSRWLRDAAKSSSLLKDESVEAIPIPVDSSFFRPSNRKRGGKYAILIQAMNLADERKGLKYFLECLEYIKSEYPELVNKIKIHYFGKSSSDLLENMGFETHYFGFLGSEVDILEVYQQSDILLIPSLQDNLPNVVLEGISCGLPVVGFETGGIPEMVSHKENGYLCPKYDSKGLAEGIQWVTSDHDRYEKLAVASREKAVTLFEPHMLSKVYFEAYQRAIANYKK